MIWVYFYQNTLFFCFFSRKLHVNPLFTATCSTHLFGRRQTKWCQWEEPHHCREGLSLTLGGKMYTPEHNVNSAGIKIKHLISVLLCSWQKLGNIHWWNTFSSAMFKETAFIDMKQMCFLSIVFFSLAIQKQFFSSVAILEFCDTILICRQQLAGSVVYVLWCEDCACRVWRQDWE